MAFNGAGGFRQPFESFFKQDLEAENQYREQCKIIREAFNNGNLTDIMNKVESMSLLITPEIADTKFYAEMEKLDAELEEYNQTFIEKYKAEMATALCPDVVEAPPKVPPLWYFQKKFMRMVIQFQIKKLWLKRTSQEDL